MIKPLTHWNLRFLASFLALSLTLPSSPVFALHQLEPAQNAGLEQELGTALNQPTSAGLEEEGEGRIRWAKWDPKLLARLDPQQQRWITEGVVKGFFGIGVKREAQGEILVRFVDEVLSSMEPEIAGPLRDLIRREEDHLRDFIRSLLMRWIQVHVLLPRGMALIIHKVGKDLGLQLIPVEGYELFERAGSPFDPIPFVYVLEPKERKGRGGFDSVLGTAYGFVQSFRGEEAELEKAVHEEVRSRAWDWETVALLPAQERFTSQATLPSDLSSLSKESAEDALTHIRIFLRRLAGPYPEKPYGTLVSMFSRLPSTTSKDKFKKWWKSNLNEVAVAAVGWVTSQLWEDFVILPNRPILGTFARLFGFRKAPPTLAQVQKRARELWSQEFGDSLETEVVRIYPDNEQAAADQRARILTLSQPQGPSAAGLEEPLEEYLRRVSGGAAIRWRPLTSTDGLPRSYDGIARDFLPHEMVTELEHGLVPLLDRLQRELQSKDARGTWEDDGTGFGWALKEAAASGRYSNLDFAAKDLVLWTEQDVPPDLRAHLSQEAIRRNIQHPWTFDDKNIQFVQGDLSASDLIDSGRSHPVLITSIGVLNYSSDPLGLMARLYNRLENGGYLLAQMHIPTEYPRSGEMVDFYGKIFQWLKKEKVQVDWKVTDAREKRAAAQRLEPSKEYVVGIVFVKKPGSISLKLTPQKPEIFRGFTHREIEFQMVHYAGDFQKPFEILPAGLEESVPMDLEAQTKQARAWLLEFLGGVEGVRRFKADLEEAVKQGQRILIRFEPSLVPGDSNPEKRAHLAGILGNAAYMLQLSLDQIDLNLTPPDVGVFSYLKHYDLEIQVFRQKGSPYQSALSDGGILAAATEVLSAAMSIPAGERKGTAIPFWIDPLRYEDLMGWRYPVIVAVFAETLRSA